MRAILFDIIHTLKSKTTISAIALILIISILGSSGFSVGIPHPDNSRPSLYMAYYISGDTYHVVNLAFNTYGIPIEDMQVSVSGAFSLNERTNNAGFSNLSFKPNNISATYKITEEFQYNGNNFYENVTLNENALRQNLTYNPSSIYDPWIGTYYTTAIYDQGDPYLKDILVIFVGLNGSPSQHVSVYIGRSTAQGTSSGNVSLGNASDFYVVRFNPNPADLVAGGFYGVTIHRTDGNASGAPPHDPIPDSSLSGPVIGGYILEYAVPQEQIGGLASAYIKTLFPVVIGLLALLIVFSNVTRLTNSGIVESITSKPISKRELIVSRYVASVIIMLILSVIAPASMDLYGYIALGFFMGTRTMFVLIASLFLTSSAFIGTFFIITGFTKSETSFMGISVLIVTILTLFWSTIISSITSLTGLYSGSYLVHSMTMFSNYLTPLGPIYLSFTYLSNSLATELPTPYDPTVWKIILDGITWCAITAWASFKLNSKTE
ncbi:MAG: ABC transporter permease [Thermoplasmataceae archaeon]